MKENKEGKGTPSPWALTNALTVFSAHASSPIMLMPGGLALEGGPVMKMQKNVATYIPDFGV
jgi:hypothetical protein